ncbi:transketolase [Vibrio mimicus]
MIHESSTCINHITNRIRANIITRCHQSRGGHIASSLSMVEILYSLFSHQETDLIDDQNRDKKDRFLLSSCQGALALYAVMYEIGVIDDKEFASFLHTDSSLTMFPSKYLKFSDMTAGSLGHALSIATGMALTHKNKGQANRKVYVLLGDGELNEGSNWEGIMAAAHFSLSNVCLIVNNNGVQIDGTNAEVMNTDPLTDKFTSFGWDVFQVDGHNCTQMRDVFTDFIHGDKGKPTAVLAETIKGKGVSFTTNNPLWHYRVPTKEECQLAKMELS